MDEPKITEEAISTVEVPDTPLGVPAGADPADDESPGFPEGDPSQA